MTHRLKPNRKITLHGLTPVDAVAIVRKALPEVEHWMLWSMEQYPLEFALRGMLGDGIRTEGRIGPWTWQRVPCDMPDVHSWGGRSTPEYPGYSWFGLIRVQGQDNESFYIKELRVTASFIALRAGQKTLSQESLQQAFDLLDKQFKSARKNHVDESASEHSVGFGARSRNRGMDLRTASDRLP